MTRGTIRFIILLAVILVIGLIGIQIIWVNKAYELTEEQLERRVEQALVNVVGQIREHSQDSTFIVDPVQQVSKHFYRVSISENLHPYYLESLLKTEFLNSELNYDFQYSIYDCFNDSVVFSKMVPNEEDVSLTKSTLPSIAWENDGHYFSVFFPTINYEVLKEMRFWIVSSMLLLTVIGFFAYVISVVLKQKRLSEIKNDFINNMTHELKTPISTIALSSDILLQPTIYQQPDRLRNYAHIIKNENQRLQTQVERVLQIARLEKDQINLKHEPVNVHEIIEDAAPTITMNFEEQQVKIDLELLADNPVVYGDQMHITNILFNLLDNAAKYGGDGVQVKVGTRNQRNGILIVVKDNGPGIAKEHQDQIFEKFYRVPTGDVHDVKGFGIGLHYVKTIAEAHKGKVKLRSSPGMGSEFEVYLPFGT